MASHSLFLNLLLIPESLDRQLITSISEKEVFDLMVLLINNGIQLTTTVANAQARGLDTFAENKRLATIRFLVCKIVSYFECDMVKIMDHIPSLHQEFVFTEMKKLFTFEPNLIGFKLFSDLLFWRWVLRFILKYTYPDKPLKQGISNQHQFDPYYVPPETHENLVRKIQTYDSNVVQEIESFVAEFEKNFSLKVNIPLFDCFVVKDKNETDMSNQYEFKLEHSKLYERDVLLDDIHYELGKWFFINQEDYSRANKCFLKIRTVRNGYLYLDGYKMASKAMVSAVDEPNTDKFPDSQEKQFMDYFSRIVKDNQNNHGYQFTQNMDHKKFISLMKKVCQQFEKSEHSLLFTNLCRYFVLRSESGLVNKLDQQSKHQFFLFDKKKDSLELNKNDCTEDGEIVMDDLEHLDEDDPEMVLLEAVDPLQIFTLVSSVKRPVLEINSKWILPIHLKSILKESNNQLQVQTRCHIILAKANELRKARFYSESRTLYLTLMEDLQTSDQNLSTAIKHEILQTDLETLVNTGKMDERVEATLEGRCIQYLNTIDKPNYLIMEHLVELIFVYMIESKLPIAREFCGHASLLVRFCSCLAFLALEGPATNRDTEKRARELWEYILNSFITSKAKYNYAKVSFSTNFLNLVRFFKSSGVVNLLSTCLVKMYNIVKDSPEKCIPLVPKYDLFPASIPSNILNMIDLKPMTAVVSQALRHFTTQVHDINLLKYYGDLLYCEGLYHDAMSYFVKVANIQSVYFTSFDLLDANESLIRQMINCSIKLNCHIQAAVLHQFNKEMEYGLVFKCLSQPHSVDSPEDLYECIWDVSVLEFLINFHTRRDEHDRRVRVTQLMSQLDLNINNSESMLKEAANLRKARLMRLLCNLYV